MFLFRSSLFALILLVLKVDCLTLGGKEYETVYSDGNDVSEILLYRAGSLPAQEWLVRGTYKKEYLKTGWDTLNIETNPGVITTLEDCGLLAGYAEGKLTHEAIYDQWYNTIRTACDNETEICKEIRHFTRDNLAWMLDMVHKHPDDPYWKQVQFMFGQITGLSLGYNKIAPKHHQFPDDDMLWLSLNWDLEDVMSALKNESERGVQGKGHCSALIKVLRSQSDVLVAHNTWTGYETMRRIMKKYTIPHEEMPVSSMSFSSYPGALVSGDDFYIMDSGLVAIETTNVNNNASLWSFVKPVGSVFEVFRVSIANRLATSGRSWANIFSKYNSGTYNNQWMIVDMKKFSPGQIKPELLFVVEQMPGTIHGEDQTDHLLRQSYWASYNIPFYPDIFDISGSPDMVRKYGDFFTHDKNPRAQIFKRDHEKVTGLDSMMQLMRYNDFTHDPLSRCNCSPPYSAENAIAARCDLNPANGSYPFAALGHRSHGATDAKVTNFALSKNLSMLAVSGPSTGAHLPPFRWSKSDFQNSLSHQGHPDLFNFSPVIINWPVEPPPQDPIAPSVHLIP